MGENPFSEPDDDRTVIRPRQAGRRPAVSAPATPAPIAAAPVADETRMAAISVTKLAAAAAPLLQLLVGLRNTIHRPDADKLRDTAARELRRFETAARDAGLAADQIGPAHFALCACLDDAVLRTPWGAASSWARQPLLATFHRTANEGEPLRGLVRPLAREAEHFRAALELIYLCLALAPPSGSGSSRTNGVSSDQLREEVWSLIAAANEPREAALSQHWEGVQAPLQRSSGARLPIWVVGCIGLAVCGGLFVWNSTALNADSDAVQAQAQSSLPNHMPAISRTALAQPLPPPPAPAEPSLQDRLREALKSDIDQGAVSVIGTATQPIIRISGRVVFAPTAAAVQPAGAALLERIATALKGSFGDLRVIAYTDNQPVHTVQFPSNFQLSTARAQAVRSIIGRATGDPDRIIAEGRADADPIASNATPEGREQNRRIELVLLART